MGVGRGSSSSWRASTSRSRSGSRSAVSPAATAASSSRSSASSSSFASLNGCSHGMGDSYSPATLRTVDFLKTEILTAEKALAQAVHQDGQIRRLLTIPGIALTSAAGLRAAIGDVRRFRRPANLVSYFGLNPSVYQTGLKAYTGHISRRGRSHDHDSGKHAINASA